MNTLVGLGDEAVDEQERFTLPFVLIQPPPRSVERIASPLGPPAAIRPLWLVLCDAIELVASSLIARASFSAQFFGRQT